MSYYSIIFQWAISIGYMVFVILSAFADTQIYSHPMGIVSLTTKYNSQVTLVIYIYSLPVIILTAIGDYFITRMNNRKKKLSTHKFWKFNFNFNL
jgi:hypothetical protein